MCASCSGLITKKESYRVITKRSVLLAIMSGSFVSMVYVALVVLGSWLVQSKNVDITVVLFLSLLPTALIFGRRVQKMYEDIE